MAAILDSLHLTSESAGIYLSSATLEQGALARGVFGGQVLGQALTAATKELPPDGHYVLNSSYFLAAAASNIALRFKVTLLRKGRSFLTYSVSASQQGVKVFGCMLSFKRPEAGGATFQEPCPPIPPPEECPGRADVIRSLLHAHPEWPERLKSYAEAVIKETEAGAIEVKDCPLPGDPVEARAYWMRAKGIKPGELPPPVQKTILAYLSDYYLIGTSQRVMEIEAPFAPTPGARRLGMIVTLDHTVWFYNDFDLADWVVHVQSTIVGGDGRAVVNGRVYTREGKLIAVTIQEGVIRAKRKDDSKL